jgi:hypothetical protein
MFLEGGISETQRDFPMSIFSLNRSSSQTEVSWKEREKERERERERVREAKKIRRI